MINITASSFAQIVSGTLKNLPGETIIDQIPVINSNNAKKGTFFVAFNGKNIDGHDFVLNAIDSGAKFALVSKEVDAPSILVSDVSQALLALAVFVRNELKDMKVVGITGSQGKTTTKEFLNSILKSVGETVATEANFNTEIGVPLTILRCTVNTKFCIVEMGARHIGDIAKLTKVCAPDVGVVLVVGSAHIGEFGSVEAIAKTKSELIANLPDGKYAVLGTYDNWTPKMADGLPIKSILFGHSQSVREADLQLHGGYAHFELVTPDGRNSVSLQVLGEHQVPNALAAAAAAYALGISNEIIAVGLTTAEPDSKWRMQIDDLGGLKIINDYYNANPESMKAAIKTLILLTQESGGSSWAILGKMHELGAIEKESHIQIAKFCQDIGVDHLLSVGTDLYKFSDKEDIGKHMVVHNCASTDAVLQLVSNFSSGDVVLLKASRSEKFEDIAALIRDKWNGSKE
ncbi:MAG: UDP-N-acetylmuramoyl-tripeptide--D-alanyl-D-alanine ligase [Actinobacteria bacterium]|nr:UDP-N-acetylmuramoyl-tripeptide--D-alanyl-D-alanine ligase [Actinomycetota bacterium]